MRHLCLVALCLWSWTASAAERPNIVFIMADDLGYAELGCYGQTKIKTPHIDALASRGMRWTQHYSGNAVCAPARCVLLTGRHAGHAFVRSNQEVKPEGQLPIPADTVTLPRLLHEAGYATGAFGKWGLGPMHSTGDPLAHGFDVFFGYNCQRHAHNFYPTYLWSNHERITLEGNTAGVTGAQYAGDLNHAAALRFLDDHKEKPFFLYYPTTIPHLALQVPEDSLAEYANLWEETPYAGNQGYQPHPTPRAAYAAMVSRLDRHVGEVVARLEQLGLLEKTLIVFTSDNGPAHGNVGGADSVFFESAGPLRGLKGSLHEGGIRVPMIARWDGKIEARTVSDLPTAFYDWLPTLLDVTGLSDRLPAGVDGISIAPTLLGNQGQSPREYLYWEFPSYGGQQALRAGDWKIIRTQLAVKKATAQEQAWQLYNLKQDIGETRDLASDRPDDVERLSRLARSARTPSAEFPFPTLDNEKP